jgi:hypothetical protein
MKAHKFETPEALLTAIIDRMKSTLPEFESKYAVKDYKHEQATIEKVLTFLGVPEKYTVEICNISQCLSVYDNTKPSKFGEAFGNESVYFENIGYLFKIGLRPVIEQALKKGLAKVI